VPAAVTVAAKDHGESCAFRHAGAGRDRSIAAYFFGREMSKPVENSLRRRTSDVWENRRKPCEREKANTERDDWRNSARTPDNEEN
jgi:hypothetical protein